MSASDVSSVPIVTNQSHPSSQISACTDPESSAAPSRARRASAASTSAFNLTAPPPCARAPQKHKNAFLILQGCKILQGCEQSV